MWYLRTIGHSIPLELRFIQVGVLLASCGCEHSVYSSLDNHEPLAESLRAAEDLQIFEGLPHQYWEPQLLQVELDTKPSVTLGGFPFYEETLQLASNDRATLVKLLSNIRSFRPLDLNAVKQCGGFHPDYCLVWHQGSTTYQALLCFGCSEMKATGDGLELHCDIRVRALQEFAAVLKPYRKNRPAPDSEFEF